MDYYIMSDDTYFLLGIEALSEQINLDGSVVYLNTGTVDSRFAPASGDVVLLAVHNIITRRRIMQLPVIVRSQLLILLKRSTVLRHAHPPGPWVIPWSTPVRDMIFYLRSLGEKKMVWYPTDMREMDMFFRLSAKEPLAKISDLHALSDKSVYALRRKVSVRLGVSGCNSAVGTLFCRDILEMQMRYHIVNKI